MLKIVSDLLQVDGFLWVHRFPPPIKTDRQDITEILLKLALNTITLTQIYLVFVRYDVAECNCVWYILEVETTTTEMYM